MNKAKVGFVFFCLFSVILIITSCSACTMVGPGYEGIKVVKTGTAKGVSNAPVVVGRVWYNPFTTDIIKYPTFTQVVTWTKSKTEESPNDDSITFNSIEGANINADVSIAYRVRSGWAGKVYMKYHCPDIQDLTWRYIRLEVRNAITVEGSKMKTIDIIGARKQEVLTLATQSLREKLSKDGFEIDTIAFVGELRPSDSVKNAINAVIESSQAALAADKKIMSARAEAQQAVEKAKGIYESAKLQAEANRVLQQSLTPEFLRYQSILRWNGELPRVNGAGSIPMIDIK